MKLNNTTKKHEKIMKTNFGTFMRTNYYIPKRICEILRNENLSMKLA